MENKQQPLQLLLHLEVAGRELLVLLEQRLADACRQLQVPLFLLGRTQDAILFSSYTVRPCGLQVSVY